MNEAVNTIIFIILIAIPLGMLFAVRLELKKLNGKIPSDVFDKLYKCDLRVVHIDKISNPPIHHWVEELPNGRKLYAVLTRDDGALGISDDQSVYLNKDCLSKAVNCYKSRKTLLIPSCGDYEKDIVRFVLDNPLSSSSCAVFCE